MQGRISHGSGGAGGEPLFNLHGSGGATSRLADNVAGVGVEETTHGDVVWRERPTREENGLCGDVLTAYSVNDDGAVERCATPHVDALVVEAVRIEDADGVQTALQSPHVIAGDVDESVRIYGCLCDDDRRHTGSEEALWEHVEWTDDEWNGVGAAVEHVRAVALTQSEVGGDAPPVNTPLVLVTQVAVVLLVTARTVSHR